LTCGQLSVTVRIDFLDLKRTLGNGLDGEVGAFDAL
jgi:hypothetical protein